MNRRVADQIDGDFKRYQGRIGYPTYRTDNKMKLLDGKLEDEVGASRPSSGGRPAAVDPIRGRHAG